MNIEPKLNTPPGIESITYTEKMTVYEMKKDATIEQWVGVSMYCFFLLGSCKCEIVPFKGNLDV